MFYLVSVEFFQLNHIPIFTYIFYSDFLTYLISLSISRQKLLHDMELWSGRVSSLRMVDDRKKSLYSLSTGVSIKFHMHQK